MDSLKGTLISIMIFALFVIPALMDVMSMGIAVSQLNKVGSEMIQVIGSSSEMDERTERAIELAEERYGIEAVIVDPDTKVALSDYELGDMVGVTLKKNITQFFGCQEDTGREGCNADFITNEKVLITKRSSD